MKMFDAALLTALCATLYSGEVKPFLHVDFTGGKTRISGKVPVEAVEKGNIKYSSGGDAGIFLDGKKSFITLNGTEKFTLRNGATLFAVVRFAEDGRKDGANDAHDAVIYKKGEFLLGRTGKFIYFTAFGKKNLALLYPDVPTKKWISVAVILSRKDGKDNASLFINNKKLLTKDFADFDFPEKNVPVTIGDGWGGCWMMRGDVAEVKIFDWPLTSAELRNVDDEAPNLN